MSDPVAILLIIGSAVVGPIEPRRECEAFRTPLCRDVETSVDQLCARAMKEIGATKEISLEWAWPRVGIIAGHGGKHRLVGQVNVRCIPAPSGLK